MSVGRSPYSCRGFLASFGSEVPRATGTSYKASRSIDLTLLEIGRFDEVVAKVIEAGATGVSSPRLRSKKEVELSDQAQALAIQDARITANSLARGFGRELGPVYAITTSEARAWRRGRGGGIFGDPGDEWLTFHPSPIEISQSVYAVFLLGPRTMPAKD